MKSLQHLEINADFNVNEWGAYEGTKAELPSLMSLAVYDEEQDFDDDCQLFGALRVLVEALQMPKLKSIYANLHTICSAERLELQDLNEVFGFPNRSYPYVTTFELDWTLHGGKRRFNVH